jgi:hypothetical protein
MNSKKLAAELVACTVQGVMRGIDSVTSPEDRIVDAHASRTVLVCFAYATAAAVLHVSS